MGMGMGDGVGEKQWRAQPVIGRRSHLDWAGEGAAVLLLELGDGIARPGDGEKGLGGCCAAVVVGASWRHIKDSGGSRAGS